MLEAYERQPEAFISTVAERGALPLAFWETRIGAGSAPSELVLGAFVDDDLVGAVGLSFEKRLKAAHKANLFGMYVRPAARKLGLGRALIVAAQAEARARAGTIVIDLTVTAGNDAALRLYESCGFVAWGREPLAMELDGAFLAKVHMSCDLRNPLRLG
jgi:ribosomal protein S18 acetylase RimI-like enzyme